MNKIEKELNGYIQEAERFSGFDSYDSAEGEDAMSYFDSDDMSYATGNDSHAAHAMSDPYVIQYQNTSTNDVTAILFGYNDNFGQPNFGNPASVDGTCKKVASVGLGCCLIHKSVLQKIKFRFIPGHSSHPDSFFAEDCFKENISIWADTSVICEHENMAWGLHGIDFH